MLTDSTRRDAVRYLSLGLAEARWQIIQGDPNYQNTLRDVYQKVMQWTQSNTQQQAWLQELEQVQRLTVMYSPETRATVTEKINTLQRELTALSFAQDAS